MRAGSPALVAAAGLLAVASPFPWATSTGTVGADTALTSPLAASVVGAGAIVLSIGALVAGALVVPDGGARRLDLVHVPVGTAWCLLALGSLALGAGGDTGLSAGPAVWLCLVGGGCALAGGLLAGRAPEAVPAGFVPPRPQARDEWGRATRPTERTGDDW